MKYRKIIYIVVAACLLLCGCQKTPEEVKESMEQYGDNAKVDNTETTYCSADELKNKKLVATDMGNINIVSDTDFSNIEAVEVLQLSFEKDFVADARVEKYAKLFGVDKKEFEAVDSGDNEWGKSVNYDNKKERKYLDMVDNGGLVYYGESLYNGDDDEEGFDTVEKRYNLDKEDISDVNVSLANNEEVNLNDVCKSAEKWLDDNMGIDGVKYKISDALVNKKDDPDDISREVGMIIECEYKGMRFDNYTRPLFIDGDAITTNAYMRMEYYDHPDFPSSFARNHCFVINSSKPVEKVIDPESAVRILKNELSGFGRFEISDVIPLYASFLKENKESPGAGIEARPVYTFLVEDVNMISNKGVVPAMIKSNRYKHFFFVDMETGELTTDLEEYNNKK